MCIRAIQFFSCLLSAVLYYIPFGNWMATTTYSHAVVNEMHDTARYAQCKCERATKGDRPILSGYCVVAVVCVAMRRYGHTRHKSAERWRTRGREKERENVQYAWVHNRVEFHSVEGIVRFDGCMGARNAHSLRPARTSAVDTAFL